MFAHQHNLKPVREAALLLFACLLLFPAVSFATAPIVDGGGNQVTFAGDLLVLQGTASDPVDGDEIAAWDWNIVQGPGGNDAVLLNPDTSSPTFTATTLGQYTIGVTVLDSSFEQSTPDFILIDVVENLPPTAVIAADVTSGPAPLTVNFDGSGSSDPEGGAIQYSWNFGDGNTGSGVSAQNTYQLPSSYTARLAVTDNRGLNDLDTVIITVTSANEAPVASPTATPNPASAGETVQFAANATDPEGQALTYAWDFGDSATSSAANPTHTYITPDTYTAYVTVSDGVNDTTESVVVVVEPAATLSVSSAKVTRNPQRTDQGNVTLHADFDAPFPAPTDVISVVFDGVTLVEAPLSAFRQTDEGNVYMLSERRLLVRINFDMYTILAKQTRADLTPLTTDNGVAVEVRFGSTVMVETIEMEAHSPSLLEYYRPE